MGLEYPEFFSVSSNTGETNTFTYVDVENLTGGAFNASNLLQGNNAICFGLETSPQEAPDILSGLYSDVSSAMDLLGPTINTATNGLACLKLNQISKDQFAQYLGVYSAEVGRNLLSGGRLVLSVAAIAPL